MEELIVIEQLPIIRERLQTLGAEIDRQIDEALSLACTESTVKTVKTVRAELNHHFAAMEKRRAEVKAAVMTPYEQFNAVYKECVSDKYKSADATLKARIAEVESGLKQRKRDELREWFEEYRLSKGVDFVNMDIWNPNITMAVSLAALKKEGKDYIDRICDDMALIETQEHKAEILVEYRRTFDVTSAVLAVKQRHAEIKAQEERQAELEAVKAADAETVKRVEAATQPLPPPTIKPVADDDAVRTVVFKVTAPLSKLRELKMFLTHGGYEFE